MVPKIRFTFTTHAFGARGCAHHTLTRVAVGAPAARSECVRLPRARGGVRPTPSRIPLATPPAAARALPCARARSVSPSRTARVCPCLHAAPAPTRMSFRSTLAAPPTHPMRPTLAMCPSCPRRRPYPFSLSVIYSPHTASARTPLPIHSSPALRPRRLLREVLPRRAHSGRAAATTERRAPRPPLAPRPHTRVASPRQPSARGCPRRP